VIANLKNQQETQNKKMSTLMEQTAIRDKTISEKNIEILKLK
jgi:hypothetical protein